MTNLLYTRLLPPAQRLATLAITNGVFYALVDACTALLRMFDADPTRIPQQSSEPDRMVTSQRKGNVMNKIILATVTGLFLTTSTALTVPFVR